MQALLASTPNILLPREEYSLVYKLGDICIHILHVTINQWQMYSCTLYQQCIITDPTIMSIIQVYVTSRTQPFTHIIILTPTTPVMESPYFHVLRRIFVCLDAEKN